MSEANLSTAASGGRVRLYAGAVMLVFSLFFLWGVANNLNDILVAQFKKLFELSDLRSGLVQSAFYLGYFVWAIPASLFTRRFGYKAGVIIGLGLYAVGAFLFLPAAAAQQYTYFLSALFIIASGLSFLETSANPLVTVLGSRESATQRLNFAQSFNSLGAICGVVIGREFILSGVEPTADELARMTPEMLDAFRTSEAQAVTGPYVTLALGVLALAVLAALIRFPPQAGADVKEKAPEQRGASSQFAQLIRRPTVVYGVMAQFLYVGAQVGVWSFMIRYATYTIPGMGEKTAAAYLTGSLVAFMIGRFASTALMHFIRPWKLLAIYAICNVMLCLIAASVPGHVGLVALAATSFFMSIMFPTIFALTIDGLGDLTKTASSYLVMAIIGGAVVTALIGAVSDVSAINFAMALPLVCFASVCLFAAHVGRGESRGQ